MTAHVLDRPWTLAGRGGAGGSSHRIVRGEKAGGGLRVDVGTRVAGLVTDGGGPTIRTDGDSIAERQDVALAISCLPELVHSVEALLEAIDRIPADPRATDQAVALSFALRGIVARARGR
jgi:hypothetical protein